MIRSKNDSLANVSIIKRKPRDRTHHAWLPPPYLNQHECLLLYCERAFALFCFFPFTNQSSAYHDSACSTGSLTYLPRGPHLASCNSGGWRLGYIFVYLYMQSACVRIDGRGIKCWIVQKRFCFLCVACAWHENIHGNFQNTIDEGFVVCVCVRVCKCKCMRFF